MDADLLHLSSVVNVLTVSHKGKKRRCSITFRNRQETQFVWVTVWFAEWFSPLWDVESQVRYGHYSQGTMVTEHCVKMCTCSPFMCPGCELIAPEPGQAICGTHKHTAILKLHQHRTHSTPQSAWIWFVFPSCAVHTTTEKPFRCGSSTFLLAQWKLHFHWAAIHITIFPSSLCLPLIDAPVFRMLRRRVKKRK